MGVYPTLSTAEAGFKNDTLYVLEENGELCASMILNGIQPEIYDNIHWQYICSPENVLVVHTLCVPPSKANRGYGKQLIDFAFKKAAELNIEVIRLDTFAQNKPAAELYKSMGFSYSGTAFSVLNGVIPEMQIFFEKKINTPVIAAVNGSKNNSFIFNANDAA